MAFCEENDPLRIMTPSPPPLVAPEQPLSSSLRPDAVHPRPFLFLDASPFSGVDSQFWGGLIDRGWAADGGQGRGKDLIFLQLLKNVGRSLSLDPL